VIAKPRPNNRLKLTGGEGGSHHCVGRGASSVLNRRPQLKRVLYGP
jgi:hypothetical protein